MLFPRLRIQTGESPTISRALTKAFDGDSAHSKPTFFGSSFGRPSLTRNNLPFSIAASPPWCVWTPTELCLSSPFFTIFFVFLRRFALDGPDRTYYHLSLTSYHSFPINYHSDRNSYHLSFSPRPAYTGGSSHCTRSLTTKLWYEQHRTLEDSPC